MSTSILRHCARSIPSCSRHLATAASTASASHASPSQSPSPQGTEAERFPSHTTLPRTKMRALISLYHQAENFITPENLSEAIDRAFLDNTKNRRDRERTYDDLLEITNARARAPKVGSGQEMVRTNREEMMQSMLEANQWSHREVKRSLQVKAALFGTEGQGKPGLEALEDEYGRVMEELERTRNERSR